MKSETALLRPFAKWSECSKREAGQHFYHNLPAAAIADLTSDLQRRTSCPGQQLMDILCVLAPGQISFHRTAVWTLYALLAQIAQPLGALTPAHGPALGKAVGIAVPGQFHLDQRLGLNRFLPNNLVLCAGGDQHQPRDLPFFHVVDRHISERKMRNDCFHTAAFPLYDTAGGRRLDQRPPIVCQSQPFFASRKSWICCLMA